jgi:CheY-like chemotaxis protein
MNDVQISGQIRNLLPITAPLLFMADHDVENMDYMEEALQSGYTGILTKPFFVSALQEKIVEMRTMSETGSQVRAEACDLTGLHFLAAEDNEINAEILAEILSIEGASCEVAENGQIALERFKNSKEGEFSAILMDVQMPVMNGYDATRAIRGLQRSDARTIPIIAMTANAFAEDEKEALDAGMDVHLSKPIDVELLKKVIKEYT